MRSNLAARVTNSLTPGLRYIRLIATNDEEGATGDWRGGGYTLLSCTYQFYRTMPRVYEPRPPLKILLAVAAISPRPVLLIAGILIVVRHSVIAEQIAARLALSNDPPPTPSHRTEI